jgi:hypothetical protein
VSDAEVPGVRAWGREAIVAAAVLFATAAIFTWPMAAHLTDAVPVGSRPPTVALFGLYTVEWTGQALEHGRAYWDAPVFHPHPGTFAWSEPQPFTSLVVWLVSKVTGTVLAYNLVLLAYLVTTGLAGYALARQLTVDRLAALWAGLWLTAGAYPMQQLNVLHLLAGVFPIACLASVLALARRVSWSTACIAGLSYFLTLMTCAQFGLFLTVLLPFVVVPLIWQRRWSWRAAAVSSAPMAAALLAALPFLLAQRAHLVRMGFERSLQGVRGAYSLGDLFIPARGHWLTSRILPLSENPDAYPFDLGVVFLLCLLMAGVGGGFRFWRTDAIRARQRISLAAMSVVGLLLGFGPKLGWTAGGEAVGPYVWLRSVVPGLGAVRTPSRFGMFAVVGVAVLAAAAFAFLRARTRARGTRLALTLAGFGLLLAEMWALPVGLADPDHGIGDHRDVVGWLEEHGQGESVLELPMAEATGETALAREVRAMRRALRHRNPIVNGYAGYAPEPFLQVRNAVRDDPAGRGRRYLDALGVRHVLVHDHEYRAARREAIVAALGGQVAFETGRDSVVRLQGSGPAMPVRPPASASFRSEPREGAALGVPLAPAPRARFVLPEPGQTLRLSWPDRLGRTVTEGVRLRGSVLVDAGARWVHIRILRPPAGDRPGEAVLMSDTRVRAPAR